MSKRTLKPNKSSHADKICLGCGRTMTWRKRWANNWDQVKYCSDACRKLKPNATA